MEPMPPSGRESVVPSGDVDILVVGTHGPDLRGLRRALGERLDGTLAGFHVTAKTVGMGMAVAGASTAKRVFQLLPRAVIHLGTCGIYAGLTAYRPHDVLVAEQLRLVDPNVLEARSTWPEPMQTEHRADPMLVAGLTATQGHRIFRVSVASTLSATVDGGLSHAIPTHTGCHAESLEVFAIAQACRLAEIPFAAVLGASHVVGPTAKQDWRQYERDASLRAAEVVTTWIANGAQGIARG